MSCFHRWLLVVVALFLPGPLAAQTPFPEFTGKRLYVSGVTDVYQPLSEHIERLEKDSPQTYYVVVVNSSGSGQFATRNYLDNMYPQWLAQANRKGLTIDPNRSVIILLAEKNRQLSVKMGTLLQSQYGLRDQAIDRQLVQPHFISHARAGNYLAGLQTLLTEIEKAIAAKDAEVQRAKEQSLARAEELKRSAEATLASANALLPEVRQELAAKKAAGMDLSGLEQQVEQAAQQLSGLSQVSPEKILAQAGAAQKQLQAVRSELVKLTENQKRGEQLLEQAQTSADELQQAIVAQRRNELATKPLEDALESAWKKLEAARDSLTRDPAQAVAAAESAGAQLTALKSGLDALPQLARQSEEKLASVERLRETLARDLERARSIGADTAATQERIKQLDERLDAARELATADYPQAIAQLEELQTAIAAQDRQLLSAYQRHYFATRTAPLAAVSLALLLAAGVLIGLRWRHMRLKRQIGSRLATFRSEVTQWMERLDALKQRHQMLPFTDEDFSAPMSGQTLELYHDVQGSYEKLRAVWLALMDRRTKAEGAFALEGALSINRLKEVESLLAGREDTTELQPRFEECVAKLDRLNQAHEDAEQAAAKADQARTQLEDEIHQLDQARLRVDALREQLAELAGSLERGRETLPTDPLSAHRMFDEATGQLAELSSICQRRLKCVAVWRGVEQNLAQVVQRATEVRGGGIKLLEQSANPDPIVEIARRLLEEAWNFLLRGDDAAAESLVEQAGQRALQARENLERHLADRETFAEELPKLRQGLVDWQSRLKQAQSQRDELQSHFHPESWSLVAENVPQAADTLTAMATSLEQAAQAGDEARQHYSQAAELLSSATAQQQHAAALIDAVGKVLADLKQQRSQATSRRQEVVNAARRLEALLDQQARIVGAEAQRLWTSASQSLQAATADSQQPQPHWPRIVAGLQQAATQIAAAEARAQEDVTQHQQLMTQLEQARARAAQVDHLLRGNTADRPRANQRFQAAQQAIEEIARTSSQPNAAWGGLLARLTQAIVDLEQARTWAEEDIRLAAQAAAALREAEAELSRSRTYVSFGISAQTGLAESQLVQASQRLQARDYEQAISLADAAERAARQAQLEAMRAAEERRRRQEEERRRREMARMAAAAAAAMASSRHTSSSFGGGFSSSSSGRSSSSSSSWSSGTSQSSW